MLVVLGVLLYTVPEHHVYGDITINWHIECMTIHIVIYRSAYLIGDLEPLQQGHKLLLDVGLLWRQKGGRREGGERPRVVHGHATGGAFLQLVPARALSMRPPPFPASCVNSLECGESVH